MTIKDAILFFEDANISGTRWADLGCGSGTFTQALATHVTHGSIIYAIDKDQRAVEKIPTNTGNATIIPVAGDMQQMEIIPADLDGILLANSLHYVLYQKGFLNRLLQRLINRPTIVLVEYDRLSANQWVPYPLSFNDAVTLFKELGYDSHKLLHRRRSTFGEVDLYSVIFNAQLSTQNVVT